MNTIDFDIEFVKLQNYLKPYLYRLAGNKIDAEDILHDTYLRAKENIHKFMAQSSFKTWLFAIANNLAKDNLRVRKRWNKDAQDKCKELTIKDVNCERRLIHSFRNQTVSRFEMVEHIHYCFLCLAKNLILEQQIAIILKEMYKFKINEISQIMHRTPSTVKHLLFDGRKELQHKYEERCTLINKNGPCYQCAELNDYLQENPDSKIKIKKLGFDSKKTPAENLKLRFKLINKINPFDSNGADLEDTILDILRIAIKDK